jgi:hypothetical protein
MISEAIKCVPILGQAMLLAPIGVEVCRISRAFPHLDSQPVNNPENIFQVRLAETSAVEVIDAE